MTKSYFLLLTSSFLLLSCAHRNIPKWIDNPPREKDACYSVGIAEKTFYKKEGLERATGDALKRLAQSDKVDIESLFGEINDRAIQASAEESDAIFYGAEVMDSWYDKHKERTYVLVKWSKRKFESSVEKESFNLDSLEAKELLKEITIEETGKFKNLDTPRPIPKWLKKEYPQKVIGVSPRTFYKEDALISAFEDGLSKLARQMKVRVRSLFMTGGKERAIYWDEAFTVNVSPTTYNIALLGAEAEDMFYDEKEETTYILIIWSEEKFNKRVRAISQ